MLADTEIEVLFMKKRVRDELVAAHPPMTELPFYLQPSVGKRNRRIFLQTYADFRNGQRVTTYAERP